MNSHMGSLMILDGIGFFLSIELCVFSIPEPWRGNVQLCKYDSNKKTFKDLVKSQKLNKNRTWHFPPKYDTTCQLEWYRIGRCSIYCCLLCLDYCGYYNRKFYRSQNLWMYYRHHYRYWWHQHMICLRHTHSHHQHCECLGAHVDDHSHFQDGFHHRRVVLVFQ